MAIQDGVFAVAPIVFTILMARNSIVRHSFAIDFNHEFWPAAHRLLAGTSPYARSWMHISDGVAFPYPAFTVLAFVPFGVMAREVANWVFTAVNVGAAVLTLRALNVRDWRLYGLTLILWPVVLAWQAANLTLVLALGAAWLWRTRDSPRLAGALVAIMISLKPFVWPLALWFIATRRYRGFAYAVAWGVAVNVISWAIVGYGRITAYTQIVSSVDRVMDQRGYSVVSLVIQLGGNRTLAYGLLIGAAAAMGIGCLIVGLRGNARAAFCLCIAECLLASPVVWPHYFALLIVPLAIYRPRLDSVWLMMLLLYAAPGDSPKVWQTTFALILAGVVTAWLVLLADEATPAPGVIRTRLGAQRIRTVAAPRVDET